MGIYVDVAMKGRPTANVVVLEGTVTSPTVVDSFALPSSDEPVADMLLHLSEGIRSKVGGLNPDLVVIRKADFSRASNKPGPKLRLLAEGALAAASREAAEVLLLEGKEVASRVGEKKESFDEYVASLLPDLHSRAAAAALAGLK